MDQMGNWTHAAGQVCFQRNINKQLYPPDALLTPRPSRIIP